MAMNSDYIELRARSAFSFLEGATTPEDLAARAAELGYSARPWAEAVADALSWFREAGMIG